MRALLVGTAVAIVALASLASTASATAPEATTIAGTITQFGPPPASKGPGRHPVGSVIPVHS